MAKKKASRKKASRKKAAKPAARRKRGTGRLPALIAKAQREGWHKWIRSEADERAVLVGYRFDQKRADHAIGFGPKYLQLSGEYEGRPFELLPFQQDEIIGPLFGWVHDSEEYGKTVRRYRRAYIEIPKKNGKSPLGYYVALYCLTADGPNVRGARVYSASTDKEQASIVHGDAINAVDASPQLSRVLKCNRTQRNISYRAMNGFYRVLSSCPRRNEGWNASCIIADELHKWYGRELWDALRWAFATRSEPLMFAITTAGDDIDSLCYEQHTHAVNVIEGRVTDLQLLPVIYAADPDDDIDDPAVQQKANPALGHHLKATQLNADIEEARAQGTAAIASLKQLRFNIWQTTTTPWLDVTAWDAGPVERKKKPRRRIDCHQPYKLSQLAGRPCWAGLDLAYTTDLTAFVLVFPNDKALQRIEGGEAPDDKKCLFWTLARFWLPERTAQKMRTRVKYKEWADAGDIILTPGGETDFDTIREAILVDDDQFDLRQMLYDPLYAAYLAQRLELEHGVPVAEFGQRMTNFAEPTKMLERLILQHRIRHQGNAVLTWCFKNTNVKEDANANFRPVKPKRDDPRKIDGTVATIMGLAGAMRGETGPGRFYDHNDPEVI